MVTIQIVNWRNYVARGDIKNISWFKLSSDISKDKKLFGLTPAQKWAWVCILCEACKENNGGTVSLAKDYLLNFCDLNEIDLVKTLEHLKIVGLIEMEQNFSSPTHEECKTFGTNEFVYSPKTRLDQTREDNRRQKKTVKTKPPVSVSDLSDEELQLARSWLDLAITEFPHKADSPKWTVERFAMDIRKAQASVKATHQQMALLFDFIKHSAFWRPNAATPGGLLKTGNNGLTKIDNIIASMKPVERRESEILNEQIATGQFKKSTEQLDEKILKQLGLL